VDAWYREKMAGEDKVKNQGSLSDDLATVSPTGQLVPHPKETYYFRIRVFFSALIYLAVLITVVYAIFDNPTSLFILLMFVPLAGFFWLLQFLAHGIFMGMIKGESVEVTARQYPEIYAIIKEEAKQIGLKDLPRTYITSGDFNAFVTSFARSKILMIYSEVVETTLQKDYDVLRFVVAHELCHLKRRHLMKDKFLFPSRLIPLLYNAYSRGREYTCDRAGYLASPHGAVEGILIMTTGKEVYSKINVEQHLQNVQENSDFWTWLSEKFRTHPHAFKRLLAIQEFSKR
jgi:Zn-dependent protease with chaperone function